jgi:hypothetical protein
MRHLQQARYIQWTNRHEHRIQSRPPMQTAQKMHRGIGQTGGCTANELQGLAQ